MPQPGSAKERGAGGNLRRGGGHGGEEVLREVGSVVEFFELPEIARANDWYAVDLLERE